MADKKLQIEKCLQEAHTIRVHNLSGSISMAMQALQEAEKIADAALIGKSCSQLALYHMITGEMDKSTEYSKEAIRIFTALQDEKGLADAKYSLAGVYYKTNLYHLGLICFIDALAIYQKHEDYFNQSRTEKSLGTIYEFIGDQNNALMVYKSAIKNARKIKDTNLESNVYNNVSGILAKNGKYRMAMSLIEQSIKMKEQTQDLRGLGFAFYGKAKVYFHSKEYDQAEVFYYKALKMHIDMGENTGIAMTYTKLGELFLAMGDKNKALENALKGLEISAELKIAMMTIKLKKLIYLIYKAIGNHSLALHYLEKYQEEKETVINTQTLKVIENYELITKMKSFQRESELQKERQEILEKKNLDEMEAYRQKQEFLSIMSHEIRTPLNAITTTISILDEQVSESGKKLINNLKFASNSLINIVNDVLDFTKLDTNKAKLETYACNLNALCQNVTEVYDRQAKEKGIQLEYKTEVDKENNYILDPTKITQILNNLISNAIKFTEHGKVTFEVRCIQSDSKTDALLFSVRDTGEGISKKNCKEIFHSFSQLKPYLTRKQGGTGLGLAIVKKLVALHDSQIEVKSKVGEGSEFYFTLHLEKTKLPELITPSNYDELIGKKALVVDDTKMNAILLKKLLSKWGIAVDYVASGQEAINLSQNKKYDFILMDIHMPEMNGFQASMKIKKSKNPNFTTPIFAVTADVLIDTEEDFSKYFAGVIYKPYDVQKLYSKLLHITTELQMA